MPMPFHNTILSSDQEMKIPIGSASVLLGNPLAQQPSSNLRSIFQGEYVGKTSWSHCHRALVSSSPDPLPPFGQGKTAQSAFSPCDSHNHSPQLLRKSQLYRGSMSDRRLFWQKDFWRKTMYFGHEISWLSARICYWGLKDARKHKCHTWILIASNKNCSRQP